LDTVCGIWVSSSGSHIGYHETAAVVGHGVNDQEDNISDSLSENDKENGAKNGAAVGSKNKGKVVTVGSKKKKNKMKHASHDSWLDREQVICFQGCSSAAALIDLESNQMKGGRVRWDALCYCQSICRLP
jgi:hypothetical protein